MSYYTPKIDEFHTGFEYEVLQKAPKPDASGMTCMTTFPEQTEDEWNKFKFPDPFLGYRVDKLFEHRELRVKYLDREDIIEFGFRDLGSQWYDISPSGQLKHWTKVKLRKWVGNEVYITGWRGDHESEPLFSGEVKNKSELKRILSQLNIVVPKKTTIFA